MSMLAVFNNLFKSLTRLEYAVMKSASGSSSGGDGRIRCACRRCEGLGKCQLKLCAKTVTE